MSMRIGIVGYGNLGRGAERALGDNPDMTLAAVFTRRDPASVTIQTGGVPVLHYDRMAGWQGQIDVMLLCGGSANDLPQMAPQLAGLFNIVDSYDNHSRIPAHFAAVDAAARAAGTVAVISSGWDPGLFSLARLYGQALLPRGETYTFWGDGVSQGHSDAIRRLPGVLDARQYTRPVPQAVARVQAGENPTLSTREKHTRECFVVPRPGADLESVRQAIVTMPAYFEDYDTTVHFITQDELESEHGGLPHGGRVIRSGVTGNAHSQCMELSLRLDSNPEFTAGALVACARAAFRLHGAGQSGCKTVFDLPPAALSPLSAEALRATLL